VDESGAADELREPPSDWLTAHCARHYRDASVGEFVNSGVEAPANTSATVLGDNGHLAEIPVGHWSEREGGRPDYLSVGDRDTRSLPLRRVYVRQRRQYTVEDIIIGVQSPDHQLRWIVLGGIHTQNHHTEIPSSQTRAAYGLG
jgi:hypothetical protein